ncbi:MAG: hypothetical protein LBR88_00990 [Zoogloeaceae bacterium]|jgi:hypothetical protein|nr:hypothetical protein [Zoogloeaceae bacterium]
MIIGFATHIMPEMAARLFFFAVQHPTVWGFAKGSIVQEDKKMDFKIERKNLRQMIIDHLDPLFKENGFLKNGDSRFVLLGL